MGTELTGARSNIGLKTSSTWGTAGTCTSTDGIEVLQITHGENAEELTTTPIGSGDLGPTDSQRGATSPSVSFEKVMHYNDQGLAAAKSFFGTELAYYAGGSTGWTHSLMFNEVMNQSFLTAAFMATSISAGVYEYPTGVVTRMGFNIENPPNYVKHSCDLLSDQLKVASQTNTFATLDNIAPAGTERVVVDSSDELLINTQSGAALATPTDRVTFTNAVIEYTRPFEHVRECKGSAGNSEPIASGNPPFTWTLTVTVPRVQAMTWFTAMQAGTEYKAQITVTGSVISGSVYNKVVWFFPRLKLISDVKHDLTSAGINPLTVVFKGLVGTTAPTGMADKYPYLVVTNTKAGVYT